MCYSQWVWLTMRLPSQSGCLGDPTPRGLMLVKFGRSLTNLGLSEQVDAQEVSFENLDVKCF